MLFHTSRAALIVIKLLGHDDGRAEYIQEKTTEQRCQIVKTTRIQIIRPMQGSALGIHV
jgi:hypothetical protein